MDYKLKLCFAACLFVLINGCTNEIQVEPDVSYDTDWVPTFHLYGNNYERLRILYDPPPRRTLYRNIVSLSLEYKPAGTQYFYRQDSIAIRDHSDPYQGFSTETRPFLHQGASYTIREKALFRDLTTRTSEETTITSPIVKGKILRRFYVPQEPFWGAIGFSFSGQYIYGIAGLSIFRYDTLSSNLEVFPDTIRPINPSFVQYFIISVHRTRAYLVEPFEQGATSISIRVLDLETRKAVSSFSIQVPARQRLSDICYDGAALYSVWYSDNNSRIQQIIKHDFENGDVIQAYPKNNGSAYNIFSDGTNLWTNSYGNLDTRIQKINPATLAILEEHRNPILNSGLVSWNENYIWIFDRGEFWQSSSFVKVQLEGL